MIILMYLSIIKWSIFHLTNTYLKDRLTLLTKSDMYWLCIDSTDLEAELNRLDQSTLAELYMLNTVYTDKAVRIVDWGGD